MRPVGFKKLASPYDVPTTMDRLAQAVRDAGMTIFARIDHAAGAAASGLTLPPTELLIFGNARAGTPLMNAAPTLAIDLPLKAIAWKDEGVWLGFNDPLWIGQRHGLGSSNSGALAAMQAALAATSAAAIAPSVN